MSQPYLVYKFMPEVRYCRKLQAAGLGQFSFLFNAGSGTKGFRNGLGDLGWPTLEVSDLVKVTRLSRVKGLAMGRLGCRHAFLRLAAR